MTKKSLKKLMTLIPLIEEWQRATFPDATISDASDHLVEEANEVVGAIDSGGNVGEELADVMHLVIAIADRAEIDLAEEMDRKFRINQNREWRKVPFDVGDVVRCKCEECKGAVLGEVVKAERDGLRVGSTRYRADTWIRNEEVISLLEKVTPQ